jgi:hypothetical protein
MSIQNRTPSTRQLENLKDIYSEQISENRKSLISKVKEVYPDPATEDLIKPISDKIIDSLPGSSQIELDTYRFHQCKRKYRISFHVFVDPEDVKDPNAEKRNKEIGDIEKEETEKQNELRAWYLEALLAATNKKEIPGFNPEFKGGQ